jgi:hypothetical protein
VLLGGVKVGYYHAVENGAPDARYAIIEKTAGGWRAELIALPYDHHAMASLAQRNGHRDWEFLLSRGYKPSRAAGYCSPNTTTRSRPPDFAR